MSVKEKDVEGLLKDFELRPEEFMFFLGAGFSKEIGLPGGQELAEFLAKKYGEEKAQGELDDVIASLLGKGVERNEICEAIKEVFNKRELPRNEYNFLGIFFRIIDQVVQRLERENSLRQVIIATTNWDKTLTNFFGERVLSIYSGNQVSKSRDMAGRRILVYHLHGSIEDCDSMILTKEEKSRVSGDTPLWHSFTADVDKHRVIFIGYSMADEDIMNIYIKSRKGATIKEKDYIIVNDEGSKRRIEGMLAENGLDRIASVMIMDSFEFLKELAKSIGLVVEEVKVELDTEKKMMEKLKEKGGVIVVGPRLSGLTTLYQKYSKEFPKRKLPLDYKYDEESKKSFIDLMNDLEKEKIALVAPEYLYENYFEEYKSRIKDEARLKNIDKLAKEITIKHRVSRDEARKYLDELVKRVDEDRKDKFDDELKGKILDLVNHDENYPLKLLRDVFQDVNERMRHENKEDIKRALDEKINMRRDAEKNLGVSVLLWSTVPGVASVFGEELAKLSPVLLAAGILTGELVRSIKDIIEEKSKKNPFDKIIVLKKYWDSLNESEKKMLCYKLDSKQHLRPGKSEEYLRSVLGDELRSLEKKVEKAETYVRNLEEFQKKLEKLEKENGYILEELAKSDEDIKKFKNEFKLALDELRKLIEELRKRIDKLEEELRGNVDIADKKDFEKGFSNIKVEDGELKIGADKEYYHVVEIGKFGSIINNVINKLGQSRVVVLTGSRGIGKSVLAASVIWRLLNSGEVELVARINEYNNRVESFIRNCPIEFRDVGRVILYDPSSTGIYKTTKIYEIEKKEQPILAYIDNTIKNLLVDFEFTKDSMMLIVLPSDIYENILSEDTRKSLEQYRIEVELSDIKFLSEIIRDYSVTCRNKLSENELSELAGEVAKYEEGYTLIARLVGMELTKSNCNIDNIMRMIEKSEHNASAFIAGFINKWFDVIDDKSQVNSKRINALAEILAIRRYFNWFIPGDPLLTKGIVKLIDSVNEPEKEMNDEMVNWLIKRSHDLVENTIERLLNGEDLGEASEPWMVFRTKEASEILEVVEYFINEYGEKFLKTLSNFSDCWKRAALIIGSTLTWQLVLPDKEKFSNSEAADALNSCKIDDYLLVDNEIPDFVAIIIGRMLMQDEKSKNFVSIFADKYENAIEEVKKLLEIWRKRENDEINTFEAYYALGLAYIVADAARLGKDINEDDADATLKVVIPALRLGTAGTKFKEAYSLLSTAIYLEPVDPYVDLLRALSSLRDKAPQQYLAILAEASQIELDKATATFILDKFLYILYDFFNDPYLSDKLTKLIWPLVDAARVYSNVLGQALYEIEEGDITLSVDDMCVLLNVLKEESDELATIAEAHALILELAHSKVRNLMRYALANYYYRSYNLVTRVTKVRKRLKELANKSDELLKNEHFMNWIKQFYVTGSITQQKIRKMITDTEVELTFSLAMYKLDNGKLDDASKLFNEITEVSRSVGDWYNYIIARSWLLRVELIKAKSINEYVNVANNFEKLWNETLENSIFTADYSYAASMVLGSYLVYLASIGKYDDIEKILSSWHDLLDYHKRVAIKTGFMLRLLGFTKVAEVEPGELIDAYENRICYELLPVLALVLAPRSRSYDGHRMRFDTELYKNALLAVKGDSDALTKLRDLLYEKPRELAQGLDGKTLVQLIAPMSLECQFAFMLYALVNGNIELAKKYAWWVSKVFSNKLDGRLFGDVYKACCAVNGEGFKLALLKLYYLHIW